MGKSINVLTGFKTAEVSVVGRAANRRRFALTKSRGNAMNAEILNDIMDTEAEGEQEMLETLKSAGASEDAMAVATVQYRMAKGFKDVVSDEQYAEISKSAGYVAKMSDEDMKKMEDEKKKKKGKNPFAKPGKEENMKKNLEGLDEATRAQVEAVFKSNEEIVAKHEAEVKRNDELEAVVKSMVSNQSEREYIAKAEKEFEHVPGTAKEIGLMLKNAFDASPELGKQMEEKFAQMEEVSKNSGAFGSVGGAGNVHVPAGADSWDSIRKSAEGYFAKSADAVDMTIEQKVSKFLETSEGQKLYSAYEAERA